MLVDNKGRLFGWGDGEYGCLGHGDGKKRGTIFPIAYFDDKRCIHISCGEKFTVVIAETIGKITNEDAHQSNTNDNEAYSENDIFKKM
jgi:alpha-tubulin suppressor-like RCC1 family protein